MSSDCPVYVQLGPRRWELGGEYLQLLEPCNHCLDTADVGSALRNQLEEKGYIYLKQVLPAEDVLSAKAAGTISVYFPLTTDSSHWDLCSLQFSNTFSI